MARIPFVDSPLSHSVHRLHVWCLVFGCGCCCFIGCQLIDDCDSECASVLSWRWRHFGAFFYSFPFLPLVCSPLFISHDRLYLHLICTISPTHTQSFSSFVWSFHHRAFNKWHVFAWTALPIISKLFDSAARLTPIWYKNLTQGLSNFCTPRPPQWTLDFGPTYPMLALFFFFLNHSRPIHWPILKCFSQQWLSQPDSWPVPVPVRKPASFAVHRVAYVANLYKKWCKLYVTHNSIDNVFTGREFWYIIKLYI